MSALHSAFAAAGYEPVVARELPTALLAMTQHYFDIAVVCSRIAEPGDGWPLAGVLRMLFAQGYVAVIEPEQNVLTWQKAINHGVTQVYEGVDDAHKLVQTIATNFYSETTGRPQ